MMSQMSSAQIVSLFYSSQDQAAKEKALQSLTSAQIASLQNIQNKSGLGPGHPHHAHNHHPPHHAHHHAASHVATAAAGLAALGLAHPPSVNPYPSPVSVSLTPFLSLCLSLSPSLPCLVKSVFEVLSLKIASSSCHSTWPNAKTHSKKHFCR